MLFVYCFVLHVCVIVKKLRVPLEDWIETTIQELHAS